MGIERAFAPIAIDAGRTEDRFLDGHVGEFRRALDSLSHSEDSEWGGMIRFTCRVVDPAKAAPLTDIRAEPYLYDPHLYDPQVGVKLVGATNGESGQITRDQQAPTEGKSYWRANVGRRVKPGDRVALELGVSVRSILSWNRLPKAAVLVIGGCSSLGEKG